MGLYIDIAIGTILIIFIIIGTCKGFTKQFGKLMLSIGCFALAIVLTTLIVNTATLSPLIQSLGQTLTPTFANIEGASVTVGTAEEVRTALASGPLAILQPLADNVAIGMTNAKCTTIGQYLGYSLAKVIAYIALFIAIFVLLIYTMKLIIFALNTINKAPFFRLIDKILGGLCAIVSTYIITIVIITLSTYVAVALVPTLSDTVLGLVASSKILSFLYNTNILGGVIANMLGITLPVLPI